MTSGCTRLHQSRTVFTSINAVIFYNDTATTEIYTLSLHDALPIYPEHAFAPHHSDLEREVPADKREQRQDRKSTRLNSSHVEISYAVFCLKKKTICWCNNMLRVLSSIILGSFTCATFTFKRS